MIGNDIIDLAIARKHTRVKEKRYRKKVLQEPELQWLEKQQDPILAFHALWAVKEATYKLVAKLNPGLIFSPKKMLIHNLSTITQQDYDIVEVQTEQGVFPAQVKISTETIEAFAAKNISTIQKASFHTLLLPGSSYAIQSQHTRAHLKKAIASFLDVDIEKLHIQKDNSIPKLYISQKKVPIDISMSHHGNWGAFGYVSEALECQEI